MTPGRDLPRGLPNHSSRPGIRSVQMAQSVAGLTSSVGIENIGKLSNCEVVNEDKCFEYS